MAELAVTIPILPGKRAKVEELGRALTGPRRKEFADLEKRFRTRKETWFIESGPQGDVCIIYTESKNPAEDVAKLIASKQPFDLWVKEQMREFSGIDFNNLPPGELPKQVLRYGY